MESPQPSDPPERFPLTFFRRQDESDDQLFYAQPRLVVHINEHAIAAIRAFFEKVLPPQGVVLDLMSSWRSHLPEGPQIKKVFGLGLNATELRENPQLDEHLVHDLNSDPALPFQDESFDAAVVTVSIQYLIRPVEVFREVNRTLREGGGFHVIFSNRMFPTKAIAVWQALDDDRKTDLISSYFADSGGWSQPQSLDISPNLPFYSDPVHVVSANKRTNGPEL